MALSGKERIRKFLNTHPGYYKTDARRAYAREWRKRNEDHVREYRQAHPETRKTRKRIPVPSYYTMFAQQGGKCAICSKKQGVLCVDHNHATGEIRALLCNNCNTGLGLFKDKPELLEAAAVYLRWLC